MPQSSAPTVSFASVFATATDCREPFDWQRAFATAAQMPGLIRVPTGAGKTEGAWLGWLWRRRFAPVDMRQSTPRRLVYCLPMRTLVEQTVTRIEQQRDRLGLDDLRVHQLMGGRVSRDWIDRPEDDAVLVGTLDQLFSRALMRGYGESRFRWPIDFGLLHSDCLWVLDEVQLFGEALATSTQLEGLRRALPAAPRPTMTVWMSATVAPDWLTTVDHPEPPHALELSDADRSGPLGPRLTAQKVIERVEQIDAAMVIEAHRPGTLTLVVVNTVARARQLHRRLGRAAGDGEVILLHSRFRPGDRRAAVDRLLAPVTGAGRIVVATQVVEAGVDISAATLVTEAAPWASVVQRLGRCNRYGEQVAARVLWAAPPKPEPYAGELIDAAGDQLAALEGRSLDPETLETIDAPLAPPPRRHVLRRRDLLGLFDTAPDLSGMDLDVSRFIREGDDITALLAWRELGEGPPTPDAPAPRADELCPVALGELRTTMTRPRSTPVYRFDHLDERWTRAQPSDLRPGQVYLTDISFGCYSVLRGFDPDEKIAAPAITSEGGPPEAIGDDPLSQRSDGVWMSLADHTAGVVAALDGLLGEVDGLREDERAAMFRAAHLHDWGKAHQVFQDAMREGATAPNALEASALAKRVGRSRYARRGFRHELASALAYLATDEPEALVAYLIAAHHGRVRLGARSLPGEGVAHDGQQVLGCREGDVLPAVDLGGGWLVPRTTIALSALSLGAREGETYTDMALGLLDRLGPFRLSYLEALLRIADQRRSAAEAEDPHA